MPTLTIDGKLVTVPEGTNIINAAKQVGIEIPHYCYHPALSVVGNCRMCLVELENTPKLVLACFTQCAEGMVVYTDTPQVREARRNVLEFLLLNHPLDCPVCDQAGECWLQIYYMRHGQYSSNLAEDKVRKHKKATPIGPTVMLDQERCILCGRCVRFCDEISKTHELGIFQRGNHAEVDVFPGRQLDNKYSGNLVDICPVGALTDRDFRFQVRVWYLSVQDSICPGCSRGCNIHIHYNLDRPHHAGGRRVVRIKPRFNPEVNQYWICDEGRYGFKFVDAKTRIATPRRRDGDTFRTVSWYEAMQAFANNIRSCAPHEIGVLASPQLTNEELYLVRRLFLEELKGAMLAFHFPAGVEGYSDTFLINADKNANTRGAEALGLSNCTTEEILDAATARRLKLLILFLHDLLNSGLDSQKASAALAAVEACVFIGSNAHETTRQAHIIFPSATFAEKDGTFTNFQGRVQRLRQAVPPLGESQPEWQILNHLAECLGFNWHYNGIVQVFEELARHMPAFAGLSYEKIGSQGQMLRINNTTEAST